MSFLNRQTINDLINYQAPHCISIFLPTSRAGRGVDRGKQQIRLKNSLKEANSQLTTFGLNEAEINKLLEPLREKLDDVYFWRNLSDGLAFFLSKDAFHNFQVPLDLKSQVYTGNHFYLLPLLSLFNGNGRFFIMNLSLGKLRFYEATRYSITPVIMEGLVPESIQEAVGTQTTEEQLQFRSGHTGGEQAMYHGHGSGSETEKKEEILKYFRSIDKGLMQMIHDERVPLVFAGVDYLIPIYREANNYPHLVSEHVSGNHDQTDPLSLHEQCWPLVEPVLTEAREQAITRFREEPDPVKVTSDLNRVVSAAVNGRVDILMVNPKEEIYGKYLVETDEIMVEAEKDLANTSLLNLAAVQSFRQGGEVYIMDEDSMPVSADAMNAVLRY